MTNKPIKLAFQAAIPRELFEDSTDCLHRVVKPMLAALREQARESGREPKELRISIMIDEVPPELLPEEKTQVKEAVKKAIANGTIVDVH